MEFRQQSETLKKKKATNQNFIFLVSFQTIDWVMTTENEFFPVIAGELGSSVETVKQYEKRLEEYGPIFQV